MLSNTEKPDRGGSNVEEMTRDAISRLCHLKRGLCDTDRHLQQLFYRKIKLTCSADSVQKLFSIPDEHIDTDVHFVRLTLLDKTQRIVSMNFYWLPRKLSTYDWSTEHEKQHPYYTGMLRYENLLMLNELQKVRLDASASASREPGSEDVRVQVHNPSKNLAFQAQLAIVGEKNGEEILRSMGGQLLFAHAWGVEAHRRSLRFGPSADHLRLEVNGWNMDPGTTLVETAKLD